MLEYRWEGLDGWLAAKVEEESPKEPGKVRIQAGPAGGEALVSLLLPAHDATNLGLALGRMGLETT